MAVTKEATISRWIGLSTDTKPVDAANARVPVGATFYEYDTKNWYKTYDGTNWVILALDYGLAFGGTCNAGMSNSTTVIDCADLAGYGNDYFNTQFYMQVIKNADSIGSAPDGEIRKITDYVSASTTPGRFTVDAFSANVQASDEIYVIHKSIMLILTDVPVIGDWVTGDFDPFNIDDADGDNERWNVGYISAATGGSAEITGGKYVVLADYDGAGANRYAGRHNLPFYADYFMVSTDVDVTFGINDNTTPIAVGIALSKGTGTWDANNYIVIERQQGTAIDRIQMRSKLNGGGEVTTNVAIAVDNIALKFERLGQTYAGFYSTIQSEEGLEDWVKIAELEDPTNYMTNEITYFMECFNGDGTGVTDSGEGAFDNFYYGLGTGGGAQYWAGDYDSSWVTADINGSGFEIIHAIENAIHITDAGTLTGFEEDGSGANIFNMTIYVQSVSTSAGDTNTLNDTGRSEATGDLIGHWLTCIDGANAGLARPIVGNVLNTSVDVRPAFPNTIGDVTAYAILTRGKVPVPGTDSTENYWVEDSAGSKADTADYTYNVTTSSLQRLVKGILGSRVVGEGTFTTGGTTTAIDTSRTEGDDYWNGCLLMPIAGNAAFQPRLIVDYDSGTDTFTIDGQHPFVPATTTVAYVILANQGALIPGVDATTNQTPAHVIGGKADTIAAMDTAPVDTDSIVTIVKNIMERVGATPADPDDSLHTIHGQRDDAAATGPTTGGEGVVELLRQITQQSFLSSLCKPFQVTDTTSATVFASTSLIGCGEDAFPPPWACYVVQADNAAPEGELRLVTDFTDSTGTVEVGVAYSVAPDVGDWLILLHPSIAMLGDTTTAAASGVVTTTDYLMAYVKQIANFWVLADADLSDVEDDSPMAHIFAQDGDVSAFNDENDSLEALGGKQGTFAQLTVPTDPSWDDANSWWEGNILQLLQKIMMYLGAGDGATNVEVTEDHSLPEYTKFTYTEADADMSEMADDSYIGQVIAQDGDVSAYDDHTMSLEALANHGIALRGPIDSGSSATAHIIGNLKGFGDNYFNDEWFLFCSFDAADGAAAPQGEIRQITDYTSSSGTFTTTAFTAVADTGDLMIAVHKSNIGLLNTLHDITDVVDMSAYIHDHSVLANMLASDGDISGYDRQTDSQEAIADAVDAVATVVDTIDDNTELLYAVADADLSEMQDDSYIAMLMSQDGDVSEYNDHIMSLEAIAFKGLSFKGKLTTAASDVTHSIAQLIGFGDNFFNDEWFMYISFDTGDVGGAPQGEVRQITDYATATGTFTTTAFTADTAVNDVAVIVHRSILGTLGVIHDIADPVDMTVYVPDDSVLANILTSDGDTSGYDRQTDSQEAIRDKIDAIQGGTETLESLDDELDAMLDLARTDSGTETMDGTELTLYEESDTTAFAWFPTWVDFSGANFGAGEDTTIILYTKIKSGGNYREVWRNTHPYLETALPDPVCVQIPNGDDGPDIAEFKNLYGVKMTGQQALIGAGWNDYDHEQFDAKAGT